MCSCSGASPQNAPLCLASTSSHQLSTPEKKKKERRSYQQAEDSFRSIHTYSFLTNTDHVQVYYERLKVALGYYDNTPCYN